MPLHASQASAGEVLTQDERKRAALLSGDFDTYASLTSDELIHVDGYGRVFDKQEFIAHARNSYRFEALDRQDVKVRFYGAVALMTGFMAINARQHTTGELAHVRVFVTQVWVRTVDGWKEAAFQSTVVR